MFFENTNVCISCIKAFTKDYFMFVHHKSWVATLEISFPETWQKKSDFYQLVKNNMGLIFGFWALKRPLNGSRTPEMDPKWSPQLPLIDLSPFPGSWTHLGASRGLRSQKRGKDNYKDKYKPKYEEDEGEAKTEHPNELLLSPAETEKMTMTQMTQVKSYKFCKAWNNSRKRSNLRTMLHSD